MSLIILNNLFLRFLKSSNFVIAQICIRLIYAIRPLLGPSFICPFEVGCTQYAIMTLENELFPVACWRICKRLLLCNPIGIWYLQQKKQ